MNCDESGAKDMTRLLGSCIKCAYSTKMISFMFGDLHI